MSAHIKGIVKQLTPESETLHWEIPKPWSGNEIKHTSLSELDAVLDTSRFHISLPISGEEPYLVDGKNYTAQEGEYFIFNPHQTARAFGVFKKNVAGYCIFLSEKTISETADAIGQSIEKSLNSPFDYVWQQQEFMVKSYRLQENSLGQYLSRLRQKLISASDEEFIDWDRFYYNLATEFLQTHRQIGQHLEAIPAVRTLTKQEIYKRLSSARSYILENYKESFSLDDLGNVAFMSKYHTLRLYRQIYGLTPYQQVLQLRIKHAKELLLKGYSPTDVAMKLSFSDRRAFTKVFKKMEGITPSIFQENL